MGLIEHGKNTSDDEATIKTSASMDLITNTNILVLDNIPFVKSNE